MSSLYDFTVPGSNGAPFSFAALKGKVVLIVNVASRCGYTSSNYAEFPQLKAQHPDLEIVLVPCKQFGDQEFHDVNEVCQFASAKSFNGTITGHMDVNGPNTAPLYAWLKKASGDESNVGWNFGKFLVGKDGTTVKRYKHSVSPLAVAADVVAFLSA